MVWSVRFLQNHFASKISNAVQAVLRFDGVSAIPALMLPAAWPDSGLLLGSHPKPYSVFSRICATALRQKTPALGRVTLLSRIFRLPLACVRELFLFNTQPLTLRQELCWLRGKVTRDLHPIWSQLRLSAPSDSTARSDLGALPASEFHSGAEPGLGGESRPSTGFRFQKVELVSVDQTNHAPYSRQETESKMR